MSIIENTNYQKVPGEGKKHKSKRSCSTACASSVRQSCSERSVVLTKLLRTASSCASHRYLSGSHSCGLSDEHALFRMRQSIISVVVSIMEYKYFDYVGLG